VSSRRAPAGPDLTRGIPLSTLIRDVKVLGHVDGEAVLVVLVDEEIFAIGATCTHYKGPLAQGLVVGPTVRCPWHHACFDLATGEAIRMPAIDPVPRWRVERAGAKVMVREKLPPAPRRTSPEARGVPESVVIIGAGAAAFAAANTLRRDGYDGPVTMVSADRSAPYDRPNLSKDFLAGKAPAEWMPLRDRSYYRRERIALRLRTRVVGVDTRAKAVRLESGERLRYGALLVATGSEPVRLDVPGAKRRHVHYLRTFADCRSILRAAETAKTVAVVGASFIGLEVAASLRARKRRVHVIAPDRRPMEKILGPDAGTFVRTLHERHGVVFHLGEKVASISRDAVALESGASVRADLVVVGIGVTPAVSFLEGSGIELDRGVAVDQFLETNVPGVFAAGDIARWPDPRSGERIRVEHWVLAERQGQTAARNLLGRRVPFDTVPFFWSQHYDVTFNYVGHAERWDTIEREGSLGRQNCTLTFRHGDRTLAVVTVGRDLESLQAERELEQR